MLLHHRPAHPEPFGAEIACAVLRAATDRLDTLRAVAERELIDHVRSRHDLEALIDRLIAGLDAEDAGDEDRETLDGLELYGEMVDEDGDDLDEGESVNEDGDPLDALHEETMPETYGRGWSKDDVAAAADERLFTDVTVGVPARWRGGTLASVHAIPSEGRAGA